MNRYTYESKVNLDNVIQRIKEFPFKDYVAAFNGNCILSTLSDNYLRGGLARDLILKRGHERIRDIKINYVDSESAAFQAEIIRKAVKLFKWWLYSTNPGVPGEVLTIIMRNLEGLIIRDIKVYYIAVPTPSPMLREEWWKMELLGIDDKRYYVKVYGDEPEINKILYYKSFHFGRDKNEKISKYQPYDPPSDAEEGDHGINNPRWERDERKRKKRRRR